MASEQSVAEESSFEPKALRYSHGMTESLNKIL